MNRDEFIAYHMDCIDAMHDILKKKNADYSGTTSDPFDNFKNCEALGLCSVEIGIMTRISDKMARLITFVKNGHYAVTDESFEDTVLDMANYLIILSAWRKHTSDLSKTEFVYGKKEVSEGRPG